MTAHQGHDASRRESDVVRILYCRCAYAQVVPPAVKQAVLDGLAAADRGFGDIVSAALHPCTHALDVQLGRGEAREPHVDLKPRARGLYQFLGDTATAQRGFKGKIHAAIDGLLEQFKALPPRGGVGIRLA